MADRPIEEILAEAVDAYRQIPKKLEVGIAIKAITGCDVIPIENDSPDSKLVERLIAAANLLIERSKLEPIKTGRVNELGNNIEEPLLTACNDVGLSASWPLRKDDSGGRTGYPDIALYFEGRHSYLEAKVIAEGSEGTTLRSFYLSPSDNPKVCRDARHILVAFVHKRRENSADGYEQYELRHFKIVDLSKVRGQIKFEYQSNNKNMYSCDAIVASG